MDNMRSMAELHQKNLLQEFGRYLKEPWYFEVWYEKIILIGLGIMGMWKILGLILGW